MLTNIVPFKVHFENAHACFEEGILTVSTGCATRQWRVISQGLATVMLKDEVSGNVFVDDAHNEIPDWELFTLTGRDHPSILRSIDTFESRVGPSQHALMTIEVNFQVPSQGIVLKYSIDGYSGAKGFRTQLSLKLVDENKAVCHPNWLLEAWSERLPLDGSSYRRIPAGYYNDTQHRYHGDLPIYREESHEGEIQGCEVHDWASWISLENKNMAGLILLKESHKCVNQRGIDTGHFKCYEDALVSTGLGFKSHYGDGDAHGVLDDENPAWATWCLLYDGGQTEREKAIKAFDALRFPFELRRDGVITSNTWGSRGAGRYSQAAACQDSVMEELERAARLGIDCVQIDDGWQCGGDSENAWTPSAHRFPQGWAPVVERAKELQVKLGIWFAWFAPLEDMVREVKVGGFTQVKLDFFSAQNKGALNEFYAKAKTLSRLSPEVQIHADLTEEAARFGYYYGRDVCSLFPQNIEMCHPEQGNMGPRHIIYTPWLSLRQHWHYSKCMNLNQLQLSVQNIDMISPDWSDAPSHSHGYCFAMAMMGLPLMFLETKFYSEEAMAELEPVISLYRRHREGILQGMVSPIGEEPSNASITGFHCESKDGRSGYVLVFRELHARAVSHVDLPFLSEKKLLWEDCCGNVSRELSLEKRGRVPVELPKPASWRLYRYQVQSES